MKKKKSGLRKCLGRGILIAGLLDGGTAGAIFYEAFTRRKPDKRPIFSKKEGKGDPLPFEKYRHAIAEGKEWLKEMEPSSEYWSISSHDGLTLDARFLPAEPESRRTVICVHGYHSTGEEEYVLMARMFHEAGFNTLLIDQRTHGASEGTYIGFGCLEREDLYRWTRKVNSRYDGQCEIYLHGVSMGAATVLMTSELNLPPSVKGIAADCGYTTPKAIMQSVQDRGLVKVPFAGAVIAALDVLCRLLAGYGIDDCSSLKAVSRTNCPIFIIHGDKDSLVPVEMGQEIYHACSGPKKLWIVEGANHAESSYLYPEEYKERVTAFFDECSARGDIPANE